MAEQGPAIADRTPIFALLGAEAVSQVGNTMTVVAGPWFVLQTTGSAAETGLVMAALVLGSVLPAVVGGPLVNRLGLKRTSVFADLASAATVASVPLLYLAGILTLWQLLVLVFVLSSINTQGDTARYALLPALARRGAMSIERANAADRAVVRVGSLVGPLVAGSSSHLSGPRTCCSWTRPPSRPRRRSSRSACRRVRGDGGSRRTGLCIRLSSHAS